MPGKEYVGADFLSRYPIEVNDKDTDQKTDFTHVNPLLDGNQQNFVF